MLPAGSRLRHRTEFTATVRGSRATRGRGLLLVHARRAAGTGTAAAGVARARAGFVVSRAVGPAVVRNRVRRRLRHLLRARLATVPAGTDLVVRALPPSAAATSADLGAALDEALARALRERHRAGGRP